MIGVLVFVSTHSHDETGDLFCAIELSTVVSDVSNVMYIKFLSSLV